MKKSNFFTRFCTKLFHLGVCKSEKYLINLWIRLLCILRDICLFLELLKVYSVPTLTWSVNSTESQQTTFFLPLQEFTVFIRNSLDIWRCFVWRPLSGASVYSPPRAAASQEFLLFDVGPFKSKKKSSAETHTSTVQFCIHLSLLHSLILAQCSDKMRTLFQDFIISKLRKRIRGGFLNDFFRVIGGIL